MSPPPSHAHLLVLSCFNLWERKSLRKPGCPFNSTTRWRYRRFHSNLSTSSTFRISVLCWLQRYSLAFASLLCLVCNRNTMPQHQGKLITNSWFFNTTIPPSLFPYYPPFNSWLRVSTSHPFSIFWETIFSFSYLFVALTILMTWMWVIFEVWFQRLKERQI